MTLENKLFEKDLLMIADKPGGEEKSHSWLVEKQAFTEKKLFQNSTLGPAIISERKSVVLVKFPEGEEKIKNILRQLQGINITEAIFAEKSYAQQYEGQEVWLLEKNKILREELLIPNNISPEELAKEIEERGNITPDLAARLALFFDSTAQFWMNMQKSYEEKTFG
ncbi:235_t:CDS:2 [Gigaspora margarita]|uniref:235_t:CDS:1 n=1 Tax=Gigaspora margarita TaxID=4874 RepID=A0ABN7WAK2_GIGMA|nr:235_t:CDS:2 [Gigaspora margarita]